MFSFLLATYGFFQYRFWNCFTKENLSARISNILIQFGPILRLLELLKIKFYYSYFEKSIVNCITEVYNNKKYKHFVFLVPDIPDFFPFFKNNFLSLENLDFVTKPRIDLFMK
jgi:hypothetical protein